MKKIYLIMSLMIYSNMVFSQQLMNYSNVLKSDSDNIVSDAAYSKLMGFSAMRQADRSIMLKWSSAENTADFFTVERAGADMKFQPVGGIEQNISNSYFFTDNNPNPAMNYYRLSVINKEGVVKYSTVQSIDFRYQNSTVIYPNPARYDFNISMPDQDGMKKIKIIDRFGKSVLEMNTSSNAQHIMHSFEKGIYIVQISNVSTGSLENQTVIIQ